MFEQEAWSEALRPRRCRRSLGMMEGRSERPSRLCGLGPPLEHEIGDRRRRTIADRVVLMRRIVDERSGVQALDMSAFRPRAVGNQNIRLPIEDDQQLL